MITPDRFIVQSRYHDEWIAARKTGVTATEIATAATEAGFDQILDQRLFPTGRNFTNQYMVFGSAAEHDIMRFAHTEFGILESDWLIAGANVRHLATPDGLSPDHTRIAEAKTTGEDWKTPPAKYVRQAMWQMHVTGAERCLLLWQLRVPDARGWFYLGWLEPKFKWIDRDDAEIGKLVAVADRLLEITDG